MESHELLLTALRGFGVYLFMLVIVRLMGKRSIGAFGAFDLLVALMLGEMVDEIIYGDVSLAQGLIAVSSIAGMNIIVEWLTYKNRKLAKLTEGSPAVVIRHGQFQQKAMAQERITEDELMALLRQQSVDDLREVRVGTLETDGQLTVILEEWAEPLQKGDLPGPEARRKREALGDETDPPEDLCTISPHHLGQEAA